MTKLNGVKNSIMHVTYVLNGHMLNLLFYILYWQKVTSFEKYSHTLTLEVQIVCKISALSNMFAGNVFWNQKGFWLCCGSILFSVFSELRFVKWLWIFERNGIVKWVIFFASFCWFWDFLLENLKIRKQLW